jgi:uncharacterized protein YecE (DUF72 family)
MQFFVGTSGYSYPQWKGRFYPKSMQQKEMLSYYARHFSAVEVNNSFYKMPAADDVQAWTAQVPAIFRFAVKAPQTITHFKRLNDAQEPTQQILQLMRHFGRRRGPLLFGLPPNFKKDIARLKDFLKLIPRTARAAFEFRHESWFDEEIFELLRARRCALCTTDAEDLPPARLVNTADFGYVRLRRKRYTKSSLSDWVKKLSAQPWQEAYVFFKHEDTGTGPRYAALFMELQAAKH